jgi:hypothetical protein
MHPPTAATSCASWAGADAAVALLHPGGHDSQLLVVRDVELRDWTPTALLPDERPPRLELDVEVDGVRYVAGRATLSPIKGSNHARHRLRLAWTLQLVDSVDPLWQLRASDDPAATIEHR